MGKIGGKIGNGAPDVEQAKLHKIVEKAVPVSDPGCVLHGQSASVYVTGRHPFGIEDVVIRVTFTDWLNVAAGIIQNAVVPMFDNIERSLARSLEMPPEKP